MFVPCKVKSWRIKEGAGDLSVELKAANGKVVGRATFSLDEIVNIKKAVFFGYEVEFKNKATYTISYDDINKCFDVVLEDPFGGKIK